MSTTVPFWQNGLPTKAGAERGTTQTAAMRRPHTGLLETITQTPSEETVLWTTGRFRVAMTLDNGQAAARIVDRSKFPIGCITCNPAWSRELGLSSFAFLGLGVTRG
jgi:hypothetical protein